MKTYKAVLSGAGQIPQANGDIANWSVTFKAEDIAKAIHFATGICTALSVDAKIHLWVCVGANPVRIVYETP